MNAVIQSIMDRRSVRAYQPKPITREEMEQIVACGLAAPSAVNRQPWHITAILRRDVLDEIVRINHIGSDSVSDNFRTAHSAVLVSGDISNRWHRVDCGIALQNMALTAQSMGLGSCYIGSIFPASQSGEGKAYFAELGVPEGYEVICAMAFGYPLEAPEAKSRDLSKVNYVE